MTDFGTRLAALKQPVFRYINRMANDIPVAEDVTAETMLKAWKNRDRFTDNGVDWELRAWVYTIARNQYLAYIRSAYVARRGGDIDDMADHQLPTVAPTQEQPIHLRDVERALGRLPESNRDAMVLIAFGDSYDEAAEKLNIPAGSVKSRVFRGRQMLQGELRL